MKEYACLMYSLDKKSRRIKKRVRHIKASSATNAREKWAKTQIGAFELVEIKALEELK